MLRIDHVRNIIEHVGYPTYLLTIVGVWKVPGAVALLMRRYPRLQEWVCAGVIITYTSHLIVGDAIAATITPAALLALTGASWALRQTWMFAEVRPEPLLVAVNYGMRRSLPTVSWDSRSRCAVTTSSKG